MMQNEFCKRMIKEKQTSDFEHTCISWIIYTIFIYNDHNLCFGLLHDCT